MTIAIRPITAEIGAELTGIDLGRPLAAEAIATISRALHDHLVLVFRNQQMSEDEHIGFARQFGEIQPPPLKTHYDANPLLHVLDQTNPKGEGADNWHADHTYTAEPALGSVCLLYTSPSPRDQRGSRMPSSA